MKKINGGFGKELEASDDIADIIDPESMLSDHIPESNKIEIPSDISEEQIISFLYLQSADEEYKIVGIFKKLTFSNSHLEYEFIMLKKSFVSLLKISKLEIRKIEFLINNQEHELETGIRLVKKIEFESFEKQIKCNVFA